MQAVWKRVGMFVLVGAAGTLVGATGTHEIRGAERAAPAASTAAAPGALGSPHAAALDTFEVIASRDDSAVVNIGTSKVVHEARMQDPFFDFFFGQNGSPFSAPWGRTQGETLTQRALGSGFIVDADGYVLTNRHVVDGADQVTVTLANGHRYKAKTVGQDSRSDIALLKIEPHEKLTVLPLGDSDAVRVGEWVMAVGNPFGLGGNSVTVGVVSFKGRSLDLSTRGTPVAMLQTDAAINPGNSGGPLINTRGEAIGINTLIMTGGAQQYSGVGFAVPVNVARQILPQLRSKGYVSRGWLGVQVQALDEDLAKSLKMSDSKGALISNVSAGSPAEKAGLKPGDVVRDVDGHAVADSSDLSQQIASKSPGSKVELTVLRDGTQKNLEVSLGTFPSEKESVATNGSKDKLGMEVSTLTPDTARELQLSSDAHGVVVRQVEPGSRAENAGLQERDVIVGVNSRPVDDVAGFRTAIDAARSAGVARLRVLRGGSYLFLAIRLS